MLGAENALRVEGDFVECGVSSGVQARVICEYLDFASIDKAFFLFDTFEGIPFVEGMTQEERDYAERMNLAQYFNSHAAVTKNFERFKNVEIVKGVLPASLASASLAKIAYLHIDLNNAAARKWRRSTRSKIG